LSYVVRKYIDKINKMGPMNITLPAPNQTAVEISAAEGMCDVLSRASAGFWLGGPMPPLAPEANKILKI